MNQDTYGDLTRHEESPGMIFDTTRFYKTWIQEVDFLKSQDFDKIVADRPHLRLDSEPGVDTVGTYVENHEGRNREFSIWMQFDFWKMDFRGLWPTCWRTFWFSNYVPWRRMLRTRILSELRLCSTPCVLIQDLGSTHYNLRRKSSHWMSSILHVDTIWP